MLVSTLGVYKLDLPGMRCRSLHAAVVPNWRPVRISSLSASWLTSFHSKVVSKPTGGLSKPLPPPLHPFAEYHCDSLKIPSACNCTVNAWDSTTAGGSRCRQGFCHQLSPEDFRMRWELVAAPYQARHLLAKPLGSRVRLH